MSDIPRSRSKLEQQQTAALAQRLHEAEQEILRLTGGGPNAAAISSATSKASVPQHPQAQRIDAEDYRALFDQSDVGLGKLTLEGKFLSANKALCNILGYSEAELLALTALDITPDEDREPTASAMAKLRSGEVNSCTFVKRSVRKDGSIAWVNLTLTRLNSSVGGAAFAGVARDITEREELAEGFRALFEQSAVGMGTISAHGEFLSANKKLCEILGRSETELRGLSCMDVTHPDDRAQDAIEEARLLRGEVESSSWEKRYLRKDGSAVWVNLTLSRLRGDGGPAFSGVVRNITRRKQAEIELERSSRALRMLSRCNEALIRAETEATLLREVCKVAVEVGGYRMASVLFAQDDEQKSLRSAGHCGFEEGYFDNVVITWDEAMPEGQGPTGRVIRSGESVVIADIAMDPQFAPWAPRALARGYRSVVALPLTGAGRTFGVFVLFSPEVRGISADEAELLHELANDLAFGLLNLRSIQERIALLQAVTAVTRVSANSVGTEYFQKLLLSLVETLGASAGFISEQPPLGQELVRPLCAVVGGTVREGFEYTIQGTPCEDVHPGETMVIERDVCKLYPTAKALAALGSQAYAGTSLVDSNGTALGILFVLFAKPLAEREFVVSLLKLFASRVAAEMVRQKSDARLREQALLLDQAQDAIFVRDLDHRVLYWNLGAERLYGWSASEVVGRPVLGKKVVNESAFSAAVDSLLRDGSWVGTMEERTKDGRLLVVECHWTLVPDENGTPSRVLAINSDVTEKKRAEEQLRLLGASVARLNDIVMITEAEPMEEPGPRIVFVNEAFQRITGYSPAEVMGKTPRILQGPETSRAELDRIREAMRRREAVRSELINYTKSGEAYWLELEILPLLDGDGRLTHFVSIERDITERKRMEALLEENESRLAQSQKLESIGQLTGGVAHDFNNLLTVIIGNADFLAEGLADNPRLRPMAEMVRTAGQRGAELTTRLLAFARRQALEPRVIKPSAVIHEMLPMLRRTLGDQIRIETAHEEVPWAVFIDPGQLESALLNLCINARDAMPEGGHLLMETGNVLLEQSYCDKNADVFPGEYVMVAVSDTGSGIPAEILGRVFEPFFTTKPKGKGTGLGLSMVYGFTKQSGGNVKIYSEVGAGTTVKLYLPRADMAEQQEEPKEENNLDLRGKETILLVEDDDLVREHASRLLGDLGYRVLIAENGKQALEVVRSGEAFDLLFTDVMMPGGMTGPQLAAEIGKLHPGIPVLFTSGYTENAIVHQGRVDTGVRLLHKPYTRRRLAEKVRQALCG